MPDTTLATAPLLGQALPVELMNTIWADRHVIHDSLDSLDAASRWLDSVAPRLEPDAHPGTLTAASLAGLRELRDAARRLAAELTGDPRARAASPTTDLDAAVSTVNRQARRATTWVRLDYRGDGAFTTCREIGGEPDDRLLAMLAVETIDLVGSNVELRACLAPSCVLYFVKDHPRREWCGPACGNRARAARHYARRSPTGNKTR